MPTLEMCEKLAALRREFPFNEKEGLPLAAKRQCLEEKRTPEAVENDNEMLPEAEATVSAEVAVGTRAANREDLKSLYKEKVIAAAAVNALVQLVLTAPLEPEENTPRNRLWLECIGPTNTTLTPNTFIGRGGPGKFTSCTTEELPEDEKDKAVTWTRITLSLIHI